MRKNTLINAAGLLLALSIGLGGLLGVQTRLAHEENRLLQKGGTAEVLIQSQPAQSEEISTAQLLRTPLTEEELILVIQSLESGSEPYPHEPRQGQLSMAEAMEYGKFWVESFFMPHLGAADFRLEEYKAGCYLWTTQEDPLLSYWAVNFSSKNLEAELILNAASGQILDASVRCTLPTEHQDKESMIGFLNDYAASFALKGKYTLVDKDTEAEGINGGTMYQSLGSRGIYAAMKISNLIVSAPIDFDSPDTDFVKNLDILSIRLYLMSEIEK